MWGGGKRGRISGRKADRQGERQRRKDLNCRGRDGNGKSNSNTREKGMESRDSRARTKEKV